MCIRNKRNILKSSNSTALNDICPSPIYFYFNVTFTFSCCLETKIQNKDSRKDQQIPVYIRLVMYYVKMYYFFGSFLI